MCNPAVKPKAGGARSVFRLPTPSPETPAYRMTNGGAAAARPRVARTTATATAILPQLVRYRSTR